MKKYFLVVMFLIAAGSWSSGCVLFLIGAGAAGAYAVSEDEIEGISDASYDKVWNALRAVIRERGAIMAENKERGSLKALIENSEVDARLNQVTPKSVRLRIRARRPKGMFPNIKLAQDLYTQVTRKMEGRFPW